MTDNFWWLIAWLVTRPWIRRRLIRSAMKRPYLHIGDYMHRWWLIPEVRGLPFAVRIHRILREDADPYLHDHPFDWRTIILDGWYREEDVLGAMHERNTGDTRAATAETLHRIDEVSQGGVWTMFIVGRRRNAWGFMVGNPARKIHWREYESPNQREYRPQP